MVAAGGSCPQHGACFMDADANMNCAKQRPEEAISDADVAAGSTATSVTFVRRNETAETKTKSVAKSDYVSQWRWPDLAVQLFIHVGCLYGFYLMFTSVKVLTSIWGKSYFSVACVCVCVVQQSANFSALCEKSCNKCCNTRWFKYDRDDLCVNRSQFVPVIFEPPCTIPSSNPVPSNRG